MKVSEKNNQSMDVVQDRDIQTLGQPVPTGNSPEARFRREPVTLGFGYRDIEPHPMIDSIIILVQVM